MRLLIPLALLAACTPSAPRAKATPTPTPLATPAGTAAVPDAAAAPDPAPVKIFKDWAVACDNGGRCTLASLGDPGADFPAVTLALVRDSGPAGAITVTLQPNAASGPPPAPAAIAIDGRRFGGFRSGADGAATLSGDDAAAVARTMANGHALTVLDAKGATIATLSLAGASAALRYADAGQGRAGTETALVATGAKPASAVPAGPALPQIVAVVPIGAPASLAPAAVAAMRKTAQCDDSIPDDLTPDAHALGGGASLVLLPCSTGAYNLSSALFILRPDDAPVAAKLDAPVGFDAEAPVPMIVNGTFENGVLTGVALGRGLGDCGVEQQFVWDGTRLRLSEQSEMPDCRGNPNFLTTWRTRVARR